MYMKESVDEGKCIQKNVNGGNRIWRIIDIEEK